MRVSTTPSRQHVGRVLLIAPVPPPYGGMALQAGLLRKLLREDGAAVELLGHNRAFSRFKFFEKAPVVRTVLRLGLFCSRFWRQARDADVIHILAASWLNFSLVVCPAILLARLRRKRVVLNYRAGDADRFFRYCAWLVRPFFRMAHVTSAPSAFLAEVIQRRIGVAVSIVPNIVNFSTFRYRQRSSFRPKMLVTRHLEKLYDVESILRAFRQIQPAYPDASLWIAGTGREEGRLRELVSAWNLSNVRFLGFVDHKTLPSIYDQCDVLLNASRIDNFPGSLMEASAAGLVVVSTKAGGIPFVYQDGKNALLVEIGDWEGLGLALERLFQDPELGRNLASAGLDLCRQFEWRSIRPALYGAYGFDVPGVQSEQKSDQAEFVLAGQAITRSAQKGTV